MALAIGRHTFTAYQTSLKQNQPKLEPFQSVFSEGQDLKNVEKRLKTFLLWPSWGKEDPTKLAEAGFYFTGEDDTVRCCECQTEISNWKDSKGSPMSVHKRVSPKCPIVLQEESSGASGTGKASKKNSKSNRKRQSSGDSLEEDGVDHPSLSAAPSALRDTNPLHAVNTRLPSPTKSVFTDWTSTEVQDMKKEADRLRTFGDRWPKGAPLTPAQLAKAGLFYKGPHDRVECAWCHGRLVNWVPGDDAVGEHARHYPHCAFIQELNNEPLRVLQGKSAQALLRLGYSEDIVLMAVNQAKMKGIPDPKAENIVDEIFLLEEEKAAKTAERQKYYAEGLASDGLRSGDIGEEDLDSNMSNISAQEEVSELKKMNEELKRSTTCKVCLGTEVNCVFLPCRHLVSCAECAGRLDFCPVCRSHIIGTVKTFMA